MGKGTSVSYPEPSDEETQIRRLALKEMLASDATRELLYPYFMKTLGFAQNEDGELYKVSEEDFLSSLDEPDRLAYENNILLQNRQKAALEGSAPANAALERGLALQKNQLENDLSNRLGPNWAQSSAGIRTMSDFNRNAMLARDESKRQDIMGLSGIQYYNPNVQSQAIQALGMPIRNTAQTFQAGLQPYQQQAQGQFNANLQNAQNKGSMWGGIGSLVGTIGGSVLGGPIGGVIGKKFTDSLTK
jgi:hypothetical protein